MGFAKTALMSSLFLLGQTSASLPPIVMKGSKLFFQNGTQFFIKGVAYQQNSAAAGQSTGSGTFVDPLASESDCKRDVPLLQALGTNAIRTYAIDPSKDHSACMRLLDDAGIYVISDLSEPSLSINRNDPKWDIELFDRYKKVVDELSRYSNVIGFFAGNEVSDAKNNTQASAYVKAAVRDTKAYIKSNNKINRWIGVGYAANDDKDIRSEIAHYFNCGPQQSAIDFWGYNIYEWCGNNTIQGSGYADQVKFFEDYSVPVFFAEYGCNQVPGGAAARIWEETTALYSDEMTPVFSGGIVYMYFQEENDFGLVQISSSSSGTASKLKDYDTLKTRMASVSPSSTSSAAYNPTNSPATCPPTGDTWAVKGNVLPPTPDKSLCDCMFKSLSCVPAKHLKQKDYKTIFDQVCGADPSACQGIARNTEKGTYGPFSMCDAKSQLGWILNNYYEHNKGKGSGGDEEACNWQGSASLVQASPVDAGCRDSLASASAAAGGDGSTGNGEGGRNGNSAPGRIHMVAVGLWVVLGLVVGAFVVL